LYLKSFKLIKEKAKMIKINVILSNILWKKYLKNPEVFFKKKLRLLNKKNEYYKKKTLICSLLLSDSQEIKKLNKKFRGKSKATDILSFPFYEKKSFINCLKKEKEIYIGDIIINLKKIKYKKDRIKFENDFNKLWIHGLIHLFGYKHKTNKDFNTMHEVEKKYLSFIK